MTRWGVEELGPEVTEFLVTSRVARLATASGDGTPHVVPVCYAYLDGIIYSALDRKPKRVEAIRLRRVRNIEANSKVAIVVDDYSEDWSRLAYVLVTGTAALLEDGVERSDAEAALRAKYPQYAELLDEGCTIIRVTPRRIVSWGYFGERGD